MTAFSPIGPRVVLKPLAAETTRPGGIVLLEASQEKPNKMQVAACGQGLELANGQFKPLPIKVGDTVIVDTMAGWDLTVGDDTFRLVKATDIAAIVA